MAEKETELTLANQSDCSVGLRLAKLGLTGLEEHGMELSTDNAIGQGEVTKLVETDVEQ